MSEQKSIKEILALIWIAKYGVLGRYRLKRLLDLTEGVTRGLLKKLSDKNLVKAEGRKGFSLTGKGKETLKQKLNEFNIEDIKEMDVGALKTSGESMVVHLRNLEHNVYNGLEQRDAAVRVGANGATTLIFKNGVLSIPFGSQKEQLSDELTQIFKEQFKLKNGDILIIGFGKDKAKALEGALAAALYTLKYT
ncbi:MAG: DUF4443 domain-containing protein [Candidatus Bathyarchaeia archaeon]|nr:DUF4443 domain-containing protein [Candidatus Bathyarchaeota archaeon]